LSTVKLAVGMRDTGTKAHQLASILWATSSGSATCQSVKKVGRFVQKILRRQSRSHALAQTVTSQDSRALDQTATFLALHALDQIATFQVAQVTTVTSRTFRARQVQLVHRDRQAMLAIGFPRVEHSLM
jgi:hypothetical protein